MVRRLFSKIGWGKFLLLWGFSLAFGLSCRTNQKTTLLVHLLTVLNDQYYFIFAVLPILLFFCGSVMEDESELVILRYGRYSRYFLAKWRTLILLCSAAWLGQMATLLLSGLGTLSVKGWAADIWSNSQDSIFPLLAQIFPSPFIAFICVAFYLLAGYCLIGLMTLWLGHFLSHSSGIKILAALYVLTVAWLKIPAFTKLPLSILTCLNHWVMLLHNLTEPWRFPLTLIVALILIAGMLWSVHQCWQKDTAISRRQKSGLAAYYQGVLFIRGNLLLLNGSILLSAAWAFLSGGPVKDGSEWIIRLFAGHGTGYFHMMEFFALLIAEVLPLWPVGGLFSQVTNGGAAFQVIRLRRKKELLDALLQVSFLWLMFWGVCLLCVTVIPVLVLSIPFDMRLLTMCIGLRILDVGLQLLLFLLLLCYTKRATIGFLCILMLHLLCVLPVPWFPVGISSLYRIYLPETAGAVPVSMASAELALGWIALLVWLKKRGIQQLFDKNGGLL